MARYSLFVLKVLLNTNQPISSCIVRLLAHLVKLHHSSFFEPKQQLKLLNVPVTQIGIG